MDQSNNTVEETFKNFEIAYLEEKIFRLKKSIGAVILKNRQIALENNDHLFYDESDYDLSNVVVRIPESMVVPDFLFVSSNMYSTFAVSRDHQLVRLFIDNEEELKKMIFIKPELK